MAWFSEYFKNITKAINFWLAIIARWLYFKAWFSECFKNIMKAINFWLAIIACWLYFKAWMWHPDERSFVYLTGGKAVGEEKELSAREVINRGVSVDIKSVSATRLDNGHVRFFIDVSSESFSVVRFMGNFSMYYEGVLPVFPLRKEQSVLVIDLPLTQLTREGLIALSFESNAMSTIWVMDDLSPIL